MNTADVSCEQPSEPGWKPRPLAEVERLHILATLRYTGGNKRRAAELLGIARSTLIQKVRRYGVTEGRQEPGSR